MLQRIIQIGGHTIVYKFDKLKTMNEFTLCPLLLSDSGTVATTYMISSTDKGNNRYSITIPDVWMSYDGDGDMLGEWLYEIRFLDNSMKKTVMSANMIFESKQESTVSDQMYLHKDDKNNEYWYPQFMESPTLNSDGNLMMDIDDVYAISSQHMDRENSDEEIDSDRDSLEWKSWEIKAHLTMETAFVGMKHRIRGQEFVLRAASR